MTKTEFLSLLNPSPNASKPALNPTSMKTPVYLKYQSKLCTVCIQIIDGKTGWYTKCIISMSIVYLFVLLRIQNENYLLYVSSDVDRVSSEECRDGFIHDTMILDKSQAVLRQLLRILKLINKNNTIKILLKSIEKLITQTLFF